jgi:hypothetical protein
MKALAAGLIAVGEIRDAQDRRVIGAHGKVGCPFFAFESGRCISFLEPEQLRAAGHGIGHDEITA